MSIDTNELERAAWLEARRQGVGASEVAALLGVDPYRSAFAVWAEKTGRVVPEDLSDKQAVQWGNALEPLVARAWSEQTGREIVDHGRTTIRRRAHSLLFATLDREIVDAGDGIGPGVLEVKAPGYLQREHWESDPPLKYVVQVQAQLAVTGHQWGVLAALIGGQDFRAFTIDRDDALIEVIEDAVTTFWRCVEEGVPPSVDGSESTRHALARLYPRDSGAEIELPPEAVTYALALEQAKDELKKWGAVEADAKNKLVALIGDASSARLGNTLYTYKTQTRKETVTTASTFRVLRKKEAK